MSGLPRISGRDCARALSKVGFSLKRQQGSHMILRRDNPFAQVVVPDHKELDRGTLRVIIRKTYDFARALRETDATIVGGFQSPMEKECLDLLLRGSASVVVCPARGLGNMRIPKGWKKPLADGRLLLLSFFDDKLRRPTAAIATERNAYVAALASRLLIALLHSDQNRHNRPDRGLVSFHRRSR